MIKKLVPFEQTIVFSVIFLQFVDFAKLTHFYIWKTHALWIMGDFINININIIFNFVM
jgi:hypothetical protein